MLKKFVLAGLLLAVVALHGCTPPAEDVLPILEREGYSNISLGGFPFTGCGEDDNYNLSFTATKNGQTVEGVVCSSAGWRKAYTVRTFN